MQLETLLRELSQLTFREKLHVLRWLATDMEDTPPPPVEPPPTPQPSRRERLEAALENFWGDMSQEEIDATIEVINAKYIVDKPDPLAWLDDIPESER